MAVIRQTIYRCDACGAEAAKKRDLVSIRIEKGIHNPQRWRDTVVGVKADLCDGCEDAMLTRLVDFYGQQVRSVLRRKPKKLPKAKKSAPAPSSSS